MITKKDLFDEGGISQAEASPSDTDLDSRFSSDEDFSEKAEESYSAGQDTGEDIHDENVAEDDLDFFNEDLGIDKIDENEEFNALDEKDFAVDSELNDYLPEEEAEQEAEEEESEITDDEDAEKLARLNKDFDTKFKSIEEFRNAMKSGTGSQEQEEEKFDPKKEEAFQKNQQVISFLSKQISKSEREIVYDHYKSTIKKNSNGNFTDADEISLQEKLDTMDENSTLDLYAENIKGKINNAISRLSNENQNIEKEKTDLAQRRIQATHDKMDSHLVEFANSSFYGVKPEKERVIKARQSVTSGKFFRDIEKNPKLVAKVALLLEYDKEISQLTSGANFTDGMKSVLQEFEGKKQNPRIIKAKNMARSTKNQGTLNSRFSQ